MQKEPADMLEEIQECASQRLSEIEDLESNLETILDFLSCVASFSSPLLRPKYEKMAKKYIKGSLTPPSLSAMYKILYHIKSTDYQLYNIFWNKALEQVNLITSEEKLNKLLSLCHKYMYYNTDAGSRYRHKSFEESVIQLLLKELKTGIGGLVTYKFSRISAFIIGYSNDENVLKDITNKIMECGRFTPLDSLNLSKGLQLAFENSNNSNSKIFNQCYSNIAMVLNKCAENEIVIKQNLRLPNINNVMRSYTFRKGDSKTKLFKLILDNYLLNQNNFSTHILKDLTYSLYINNFLIPDIMEKMVDYILEKNSNLLGTTVYKLLYLNYYLGYIPKKIEDFSNVAAELLIR